MLMGSAQCGSKGVLKMEIRKMTLGAFACMVAAGWLATGCSSDRDQTPPTIVTTTAPAPQPTTTYIGPVAAPVSAGGVPQTNNTNAGPGGPAPEGPLGKAAGLDRLTTPERRPMSPW